MKLHNFKFIVFSGPSAVGKSFAAKRLLQLRPDIFKSASLYTTREQRSTPDSDRISVTKEEFEQLINDDAFIMYDEYVSNLYGYPKSILDTNDRITIINTWPEKVPFFAKRNDTLVVLMQAPDSWEDLLIKRMQKRGDSPEMIHKRTQQIEKDIATINEIKHSLKDSDIFFTVHSATSTEDDLVPKILTQIR